MPRSHGREKKVAMHRMYGMTGLSGTEFLADLLPAVQKLSRNAQAFPVF
ncbi:hypothetical protein [Lacimicrobium alkaliphilum]|nr:hypothetical protein [Lacimicrobium alkaliphilum]